MTTESQWLVERTSRMHHEEAVAALRLRISWVCPELVHEFERRVRESERDKVLLEQIRQSVVKE